MTIDVSTAAVFMATHARVLDRRRFEPARGGSDPSALVAALDGYRNDDGGYGWGLEPDLRSPESQPGAAHHAFEVFEQIGPATVPQAAALCDWLDSVSLPDGGLPIALPMGFPEAAAPWWRGADSSESSLQITALTAAGAHRVAEHDAAVAAHPWPERATRYCLAAIEAMDEAPSAYALAFSVRLLDAVHEGRPGATDLLRKLSGHVPADGRLRVSGGAEDEWLYPLDLAPYPDRPARELFGSDLIAADLERLAGLQQDDGGWVVDFPAFSPAAALEWRGYATVRALDILRRNAG